MTNHNPFAAPESLVVDPSQLPSNMDVNWLDFSDAKIGLRLMSWGLALTIPAWILPSLHQIPNLRIGQGDQNLLWNLLLAILHFGITALPIAGGLECLWAPVSRRGRTQLVASIALLAIPWLWRVFPILVLGRWVIPLAGITLPVTVCLSAISTICFSLFVQQLIAETGLTFLTAQAHMATVSLRWLTCLLVLGMLWFRFFVFNSPLQDLDGLAALLFYLWACISSVFLARFVSLLTTLRKAISEGCRAGHWP